MQASTLAVENVCEVSWQTFPGSDRRKNGWRRQHPDHFFSIAWRLRCAAM